MDIAGLLMLAGINTGLCVMFFAFYAILRKRPGNACIYFRKRLAPLRSKGRDRKLVPKSISEAWQASNEQILESGGLDAVVFLRIITFSIRIFSIAAPICIALAIPWSYFGKEKVDQHIPSMSLDLFTIRNITEGSKWLWVHCLALYIISCSACALLYFEYKNIAKMRLEHIVGSSLNPSYFTIIVRAIPSSPEESRSDSVRNFFTDYHPSTYLSHQMVYQSGTVQKLMMSSTREAERASASSPRTEHVPMESDANDMFEPEINISEDDIQMSSTREAEHASASSPRTEHVPMESDVDDMFEPEINISEDDIQNDASKMIKSPSTEQFGNVITEPDLRDRECAAALVFFKTRYAALIASQVLQSENPMSWVTDVAPEPHDVDWENLSIPHGQLWFRRLSILLASIAFMVLFLIPVSFIQRLLLLGELEKRFPFLSEVLKNKFVVLLIKEYLPSVVLTVCLYAAPPVMMFFSKIEGHLSHCGRRNSACGKVLCFFIWNLFFVYISSADILQQLGIDSSPKDMIAQLTESVPRQATFFTTYVMTSGWVGLASEIMQPFALVCNIFNQYILRKKDEPSTGTLSFPYDTEIPKLLLYVVLGFTYSLMAPLILPFLLVFFFLASLVYRNQQCDGIGGPLFQWYPVSSHFVHLLPKILNVYDVTYESAGQLWPLMHNTTIVTLVLIQVIAIGVFILKRSLVAAVFTCLLVIFTLYFNEYCRHRFLPVFKYNAAQVVKEMDRRDEGRNMEVIYKQLRSAYCRFPSTSNDNNEDDLTIRIPEDPDPGSEPTEGNGSWGPSSMEMDRIEEVVDRGWQVTRKL